MSEQWEMERRFRSLVENSSEVITVVGPGLEILFQNESVSRLLGYEPAELVGTKFSALVDPPALGTLRAACAAVADGLGVQPVRLRLRHKDGSWVDAETAVRNDEVIGQLVLTTRDARDRVRTELRLRAKATQQTVVAELSARALGGESLEELMLHAVGEIARTLEADYAGIHHYEREKDGFVLCAGVGLEELTSSGATDPGRRSHLSRAMSSGGMLIVTNWATEPRAAEAAFYYTRGVSSSVSVRVPGADEPYGVLTVASTKPCQSNYEDGAFLQATVNVLAAAIARHQSEQIIRHQALHDAVTGLPNRTLLEDRLTAALAAARRHQRNLAVLFLDLDNFKRVNDSLGHTIGDEVLRAVAARLEGCLRAEDTLARFGGDEFVILLSEITSEEDWMPVVERINTALQAPVHAGDRQLLTTVSIGIALGGVSQPVTHAQALLRDADLAMYAAKQRGPGEHEVFAEHMYDAAVQRLDLLGDLREAIEQHQFEAHFQPIVSLDQEAIVGVEALVRWRHPRRGLLSPAVFLPLAQETGLIVALGRLVLRDACENLARWQRSGSCNQELYVCVNLSSEEIHAPDLVSSVKTVLAQTGVRADSLVLEITEGALLMTGDDAALRLRELRELGVRLAVDDFGTGYSALSHLQHLPVDILKIDKAFVDRLGQRAGQEQLLTGIIQLAHGINLETIAEGIETPAQAQALRGMHAGLGQGFHFSKPLTASQIDELLGSPAVAV